MTRESDVHQALVKRIELLGGEYRRVKWSGRNGAPDVLILLTPNHYLVEEKRPGEEPTINQANEHKVLRDAGFTVLVISTFEEIDQYFPLPKGHHGNRKNRRSTC